MIHGRNLIVALDGVAVAGAKSCQFELSRSFIQACSPTDAQVLDKIPTIYDWSVSVDCLVPNSNLPVSLKDKLIAGTKCLLTFTDGSGDNRAGFVYVKSCDESGNIGSLATFKASFESSGALYKCTFYNNGSFPQEGIGFELAILNGSIRFDYDAQRQGGPYVVEVAPGRAGKLMLFTNDVWAAYADNDEQDILYYLYNIEPQSLEERATEFGNSDHTFELSLTSQSRVIVCNTKPTVIFLYE